MATDTWTASSSGSWSTGGNWSALAKPQSGEDVVIDTGAPQTIDFDVAGLTIGGLTLGADDLDLTGGALTVAGGATLTGATIDGAEQFATKAATTLSGAVTIGGTVEWANSGTVTQSAATVTIGDNPSDVAALDNWKSGTWDIADASTIELGGAAASWIYNAGTFAETNSGTGDTAVVKVDFRSVGTISVTGGNDLEFDGAQSFLSGTYVGPGMIDYGPDGVATLGDLDITSGACGTNWGVVDVKGLVQFNDGSTIMNDQNASWNFDGNVGLALAAGSGGAGGPSINSMGTIAKIAGDGVSRVAINVTDTGMVKVDSGALAFDGAVNSFDGAIGGAGAISFGGGGATTLYGSTTFAVASVTVTGASTELIVAGGIACADPFHLSDGASLAVTGGFALTISSTFTEKASSVTLGDATGGGHDGILVIAKKGVYDIADDSGIRVVGAAGSQLRNAGRFEKTGGSGASAIAAAVANNGSIVAQSGTLDLLAAVTGAGTMTISGDARLQLHGAVGSGQTVTFAVNAGGRLVLDDLASAGGSLFHAAIDNFGAGDSIDAGAPFGAGTKFVYHEDAGDKMGVLTLTNGTTEAQLHFIGDYKTSDFIPHSAANNGTILTFG